MKLFFSNEVCKGGGFFGIDTDLVSVMKNNI